MSEWIAVLERKPGIYVNVLLAFEHHWNQVVGFYCGEDEWYETSADDNNSRTRSKPKWWAPIPQVPHYAGDDANREQSVSRAGPQTEGNELSSGDQSSDPEDVKC